MIISTTLSRMDHAAGDSSTPWHPGVAVERRQLEEDLEALRQREQNLRDYEARLRAMQAEIELSRAAGTPAAPARTSVTPSIFHRPPEEARSGEHPDLTAAWEKLHRARELLDAEQAHVRDDRLALREFEKALQRREDAVAARERELAGRVTAKPPAAEIPATATAEANRSALESLSRTPFDFARRMLGRGTE